MLADRDCREKNAEMTTTVVTPTDIARAQRDAHAATWKPEWDTLTFDQNEGAWVPAKPPQGAVQDLREGQRYAVEQPKPAPTPEPPAPEILPMLADAGMALGALVGYGVWFVVCIPLGIIAGLFAAIMEPGKPEKPQDDYHLPRRTGKPRVTVERTYFHEKITSE